MSMDYFRRPQLAGKNLKRLSYATIRGSVRRHDADINSAVPYFPGLSGTTLDVVTQGGSATASFTSDGLAAAIATLNVVLGPIGATAYEMDGVIYIRSNVQGSAGSVSIGTGSSLGASILGFDSGVSMSTGGDIPSSPEGRTGNPFGAVFPGRGENFSMDAFRASLGRLSGNMDVMFSDATRTDTCLKKVTDFVNHNSYLSIGTGTKVFTGPPSGFLSKDSTREEIAPYFLLVDPNTSQPLLNKVTAVTRNQTTFPSADATSWQDAGNVLGRNLTKGTFTISSITDGKVVNVSASFSAFGVSVGDFAEITGATNITPFGNNGLRWVVEKVVGNQTVHLRPASKSELASLSQTFSDVHPIVELNDTLGLGESYGSVKFYGGLYCNGATLIVEPPIPSGAFFDLWATVPRSVREGSIEDPTRATTPLTAAVSADNYIVPHDGFVTAPLVTVSDPNIVIGDAVMRVNGRHLTIPGYSHDTTGEPLGDRYIVWDSVTGYYTSTSDVTKVISFPNDPTGDFLPGTGPGGATDTILVCKYVVHGPGTAPSVERCARQIADGTRVVTVGNGGQFSRLDQAVEYLNAYELGGTAPKAEILLVSDSTLSVPIKIEVGNLTIRGATPGMKLYCDSALDTAIFTIGTRPVGTAPHGTIRIEDVVIARSNAVSPLFDMPVSGANTDKVFLERVSNTMAPGYGPLLSLVGTSGNGSIGTLSVKDCDFTLQMTVSRTAESVYLENSTFSLSAVGGETQILMASGFLPSCLSAPWGGVKVRVTDCKFIGWGISVGGVASFIYDDGAPVDIVVIRSQFTGGTAQDPFSLFAYTDTALFRDCVINIGTPGILGTVNTVMENCQLHTGASSDQTAWDVGEARGCAITNSQTDSNSGIGATILKVSRQAVNNTISGTATVGIQARGSSGPVLIEGNLVLLTTTGVDPYPTVLRHISAIPSLAHPVRIIGNQLTTTTGDVPNGSASYAIYVSGANYTITGNSINIAVRNIGGMYLNGTATGAPGDENQFNVSCNKVYVRFMGTPVGIEIGPGGSVDGVLDSNLIYAYGSGGNSATGLKLNTLTTHANPYKLRVTGNRITGNAGKAVHPVPKGTGPYTDLDMQLCSFTGNKFEGTVGANVSYQRVQHARMSGNVFGGNAYFGNDPIVSGNEFMGSAYVSLGSPVGTLTIGSAYFEGNTTTGTLNIGLEGGSNPADSHVANIIGNRMMDELVVEAGTAYVRNNDIAMSPMGNSMVMHGGEVTGNIFAGAVVASENLSIFSHNTAPGDLVTLHGLNGTVVSGNRFWGVNVLDTVNAVFTSNFVLTDCTLTGDSGALVEGNTVIGTANFSCSRLANNYLEDSVAVTGAEVTGNVIGGNLTPSSCVVTGNRISGNIIKTGGFGSYLTLNGNFVSGYINIQETSGPNPLTVTNNTAGSEPSTFRGDKMAISGNRLQSCTLNTNTSTGWVNFSSNTCESTLTVLGTSTIEINGNTLMGMNVPDAAGGGGVPALFSFTNNKCKGNIFVGTTVSAGAIDAKMVGNTFDSAVTVGVDGLLTYTGNVHTGGGACYLRGLGGESHAVISGSMWTCITGDNPSTGPYTLSVYAFKQVTMSSCAGDNKPGVNLWPTLYLHMNYYHATVSDVEGFYYLRGTQGGNEMQISNSWFYDINISGHYILTLNGVSTYGDVTLGAGLYTKLYNCEFGGVVNIGTSSDDNAPKRLEVANCYFKSYSNHTWYTGDCDISDSFFDGNTLSMSSYLVIYPVKATDYLPLPPSGPGTWVRMSNTDFRGRGAVQVVGARGWTNEPTKINLAISQCRFSKFAIVDLQMYECFVSGSSFVGAHNPTGGYSQSAFQSNKGGDSFEFIGNKFWVKDGGGSGTIHTAHALALWQVAQETERIRIIGNDFLTDTYAGTAPGVLENSHQIYLASASKRLVVSGNTFNAPYQGQKANWRHLFLVSTSAYYSLCTVDGNIMQTNGSELSGNYSPVGASVVPSGGHYYFNGNTTVEVWTNTQIG